MAVPPPSPPHEVDKPSLRRALRAARMRFVTSLGAAGLAARLADLHRNIWSGLAGEGVLAGFTAHGGEPDVMPLLVEAARSGRAVALPRMDADGMAFAAWSPDDALTAGPLGIVQPGVAAASVTPAVLLVPLLGFDRAGARLGQGGGHYDRWLAAHPQAIRIGIGWSVQEVTVLPSDPWDVPLHAIVTEREWIAS